MSVARNEGYLIEGGIVRTFDHLQELRRGALWPLLVTIVFIGLIDYRQSECSDESFRLLKKEKL